MPHGGKHETVGLNEQSETGYFCLGPLQTAPSRVPLPEVRHKGVTGHPSFSDVTLSSTGVRVWTRTLLNCLGEVGTEVHRDGFGDTERGTGRLPGETRHIKSFVHFVKVCFGTVESRVLHLSETSKTSRTLTHTPHPIFHLKKCTRKGRDGEKHCIYI